jgi:poly [ADP-ribose] polymerase
MADLSSGSTTVTTQDEPAERRMFQLTDLDSNHNKFYLVELWPSQPGTVRFRAQWGRVGSKAQVKEKLASIEEVERQIEEKLRKGYRQVDLHRPDVEEPASADGVAATRPAPKLEPQVAQLLEWVFTEAGEHIQSFLAVAVEALSQAQIAEGRKLLAQAQQQYTHFRLNPFRRGPNLDALASTVQAYYNAIPTRLPARVNREEVVMQFCKELSEQENRLLQLEAAIATMKVQRQHPGFSPYDALGAEIRLVAPEDDTHKRIREYIQRTQVHSYKVRVRDVFDVHIPAERKVYEANRVGASRRELLFHGTRNQYVRHILRQGLICPKTPSNGRMLGNGIYLANRASKSTNYCQSGRRGVPRMLFLVEAALGNAYVAPKADGYNKPPSGYDSVWGKAGHTRTWGSSTLAHDEFVLYSPAQQTIRYLVTFDQA